MAERVRAYRAEGYREFRLKVGGLTKARRRDGNIAAPRAPGPDVTPKQERPSPPVLDFGSGEG